MQLHLVRYTGAPFPKFASFRGATGANFGNKGGTSKETILVPLVDLKFLHDLAAGSMGTSNRRH
jgi:hypothetical protein